MDDGKKLKILVKLIFTCITIGSAILFFIGKNNESSVEMVYQNELQSDVIEVEEIYSLSLLPSESGSKEGTIKTEVNPEGYPPGTELTIEAIPHEGHFFGGWYDSPEGGFLYSQSPSYSFTINHDRAFYAQFHRESEVTIPDPVLERIIREELNRPEGQLYHSDLYWILYLNYSPENGDKISDLSGIEYLSLLSSIVFKGNEIKDLSPLKNLKRLSHLELAANRIEDISPLAQLEKLSYLDLSRNRIREINAMEKMKIPHELYLQDNLITDLTPLLNNEQPGSGNIINLKNNKLPKDQLKALRKKGVFVM